MLKNDSYLIRQNVKVKGEEMSLSSLGEQRGNVNGQAQQKEMKITEINNKNKKINKLEDITKLVVSLFCGKYIFSDNNDNKEHL